MNRPGDPYIETLWLEKYEFQQQMPEKRALIDQTV